MMKYKQLSLLHLSSWALVSSTHTLRSCHSDRMTDPLPQPHSNHNTNGAPIPNRGQTEEEGVENPFPHGLRKKSDTPSSVDRPPHEPLNEQDRVTTTTHHVASRSPKRKSEPLLRFEAESRSLRRRLSSYTPGQDII